MSVKRLFVSVDMDEWYFARWATGAARSYWPDLCTCFREVYQSDRPIGEIYEPTGKILDLFDSLRFKSTFFFTGLIATYYPDLVRLVADRGHEIACHNFYHLDYKNEPRTRFYEDLGRAKDLLEDLSKQEIIGYRSPNSSIPPWLVGDLEKCGFRYDSSVTPTRRLMGKFGAFTNAPRRPYRPGYESIAIEGDAHLWEFPWATVPILKLPAGSGIMHRIGGDVYNAVANGVSLRRGHSSYYFHPYEIHDSPILARYTRLNLSTRIFNRRIGETYLRSLERFLHDHQHRLVSGKQLLELCESGDCETPSSSAKRPRRDFTHCTYRDFIGGVRDTGFEFRTFNQGFSCAPSRLLMIRHDVDWLPQRALGLARLEAEAEVRSTYFIRTKPHAFDPYVVAAIRDLGHEIGYHYEALADCAGNEVAAWALFRRELEKLRAIAPVTSIAMHGRPFSKWDGRDLWERYDYRALGITCEAYLDVDWARVQYFTDTGRMWNGWANRRDRPAGAAMPVLPSTSALTDYLRAAGGWVVISAHPERWTGSLAGWLQALATDFGNNIAKKLILGAAPDSRT
jgi:peptidoglycan/xylan/chitin deacetylase (PgdA/CDA1 family)